MRQASSSAGRLIPKAGASMRRRDHTRQDFKKERWHVVADGFRLREFNELAVKFPYTRLKLLK
jgi:hypothetical protein